jgi:hypothetical protein
MTQAQLDVETFFRTFRAYHESFMAAPFLWLALALGMVWLAARPTGRSDRMVSLFLAAVWVWAGVAYLILSHGPVNPAGYTFGALFVVQGLLFLHAGVVRHRLAFGPKRDAYGIAGAVLIGYALVIYPLIGVAVGHRFPAAPTFGVPCPTTIFTLGILLWTVGRVPGWILAIPALWALAGAPAALQWGVWQDLAMPAAGIVAVAMLVARNRQRPLSPDEEAENTELTALAGVG